MSIPTMNGMEDVLREFKESMCDGMSGVMRIDGPNTGPVLGITACTHGNEPSGLAIFHHLLNDLNIKETLKCGTLYLVVNNIKAAEKFFAATTEKEKKDARYADMNMNRLPPDVLSSPDLELKYEMVRARELHPIWERFEYGLDIHSTLVDTMPMIISRGNNFERIANLVRGFPIEILISNIDRVQIGVPPFSFYGANSDVPVFAIEAGQHTKSETLERARDCAVALLQNLGMFLGTPEIKVAEYKEYEIVDSILFLDKSFDFLESINDFYEIKKGDLLAESKDGRKMYSLYDGHLVIPTSRRGEDKDITEEVSFISLPMKVRKVS